MLQFTSFANVQCDFSQSDLFQRYAWSFLIVSALCGLAIFSIAKGEGESWLKGLMSGVVIIFGFCAWHFVFILLAGGDFAGCGVSPFLN